jgi:hypothetical protein
MAAVPCPAMKSSTISKLPQVSDTCHVVHFPSNSPPHFFFAQRRQVAPTSAIIIRSHLLSFIIDNIKSGTTLAGK